MLVSADDAHDAHDVDDARDADNVANYGHSNAATDDNDAGV